MGGHLSTPNTASNGQLGKRKVQWGQCLLLGRASIQLTSIQMKDSGSASKQHQNIGSSSLICLGIADVLRSRCLHQQLLATLPFKIIKTKKKLKMQFLLLQTAFKFSRDIHQTVHAGNTSISAESLGQQGCSFLPEDPFQKEAILNSTHSCSQRLVLFQMPIPSFVMWIFFPQISILNTLSTYKISPFSIF